MADNAGMKWKWLGLAVLAVAAIAVAAFLLVPPAGPSASDKTAAPAPKPLVTSAPPTAVFLGDSYSQGTGASSKATRWTTLVSSAMGWGEVNDGRGGTGYVATSDVNGCGLSFCPNYPAMIDLAVADKPKVVVVAGGQNDLTTFINDPVKVKAAISLTFKTLRDKLPDATIVAIGPSTPWGVGGPVIGLDQAVQDAASTVKAKYVSLINPDVIDPATILPDKAHVNDAGHKAIRP